MSTNVLIIPEDFRKDQYLLKPIIQKMMQEIGFSSAKVRVCQNPLLQGVGEALKWQRINEIIEMYQGMIQLFLLLVDRDCNETRRAKLDNLEQQAITEFGERKIYFLAENAWQEVEVWALAGQTDYPAGQWKQVRSDCDPKENYYDEYVKTRNLFSLPYEGRDVLGKEAAKNYSRLRQLCPEDVQNLENRIQQILA